MSGGVVLTCSLKLLSNTSISMFPLMITVTRRRNDVLLPGWMDRRMDRRFTSFERYLNVSGL